MQEEPVEAVLLGRISLFVRLLNFPFTASSFLALSAVGGRQVVLGPLKSRTLRVSARPCYDFHQYPPAKNLDS